MSIRTEGENVLQQRELDNEESVERKKRTKKVVSK